MKVTIAICCFNHADFVAQAINSALTQTYSDIEVIVIDDGSTDSSSDIIGSYDGKIISIRQKNCGQVSGYNKAINIATGDIVLFLDADDFLYEGCVSRVVEKFSTENIVKCHFYLDAVDESGSSLNLKVPSRLSNGDFSDLLIKVGFLYYSSPGSGNAYSLSTLRKLYPLPVAENDKHGADFYAIYGVCLHGSVGSIDTALGGYRILLNKGAASSYVFGNAASSKNEPLRQVNREATFIAWSERISSLGFGKRRLVSIPTVKLKLSAQFLHTKAPILQKESYARIYDLFLACRFDFERRFLDKFIILTWAVISMILPIALRRWLVRKVCNPLSR